MNNKINKLQREELSSLKTTAKSHGGIKKQQQTGEIAQRPRKAFVGKTIIDSLTKTISEQRGEIDALQEKCADKANNEKELPKSTVCEDINLFVSRTDYSIFLIYFKNLNWFYIPLLLALWSIQWAYWLSVFNWVCPRFCAVLEYLISVVDSKIVCGHWFVVNNLGERYQRWIAGFKFSFFDEHLEFGLITSDIGGRLPKEISSCVDVRLLSQRKIDPYNADFVCGHAEFNSYSSFMFIDGFNIVEDSYRKARKQKCNRYIFSPTMVYDCVGHHNNLELLKANGMSYLQKFSSPNLRMDNITELQLGSYETACVLFMEMELRSGLLKDFL